MILVRRIIVLKRALMDSHFEAERLLLYIWVCLFIMSKQKWIRNDKMKNGCNSHRNHLVCNGVVNFSIGAVSYKSLNPSYNGKYMCLYFRWQPRSARTFLQPVCWGRSECLWRDACQICIQMCCGVSQIGNLRWVSLQELQLCHLWACLFIGYIRSHHNEEGRWSAHSENRYIWLIR